MPITWLDDVEPSLLADKRVLLRVDFNVPLDEHGNVLDAQRIELTLPTIKKLLDAQAKVIILTHLGRPKGKLKSSLSLAKVAHYLRDLIDIEVVFVHDCVGDGVSKIVQDTPKNQLIFLENTRFHPGEENNDPVFAKMLAKNMDIYINDAFGAIHRAHASVDGIVKYFKQPLGGLLLKREIETFSSLLSSPKKPFVAIIGGSKVSSKIGILLALLKKVDSLLIGGAMAYTFLYAKGENVGASLIEKDKINLAHNLLDKAFSLGVNIYLPIDHVVASDINNISSRVVSANEFATNDIGLDIGPKTRVQYKDIITKAQSIFLNGPMGLYEKDEFMEGTSDILHALADNNGFTMVGGGDSIAALNKLNLSHKVKFISSGGGAGLEFIEGKILPGLLALGYYQ